MQNQSPSISIFIWRLSSAKEFTVISAKLIETNPFGHHIRGGENKPNWEQSELRGKVLPWNFKSNSTRYRLVNCDVTRPPKRIYVTWIAKATFGGSQSGLWDHKVSHNSCFQLKTSSVLHSKIWLLTCKRVYQSEKIILANLSRAFLIQIVTLKNQYKHYCNLKWHRVDVNLDRRLQALWNSVSRLVLWFSYDTMILQQGMTGDYFFRTNWKRTLPFWGKLRSLWNFKACWIYLFQRAIMLKNVFKIHSRLVTSLVLYIPLA